MEQINFKTTDSLFSRIKEDFSNYTNAGLIDSGRFFADVKYILGLLGVNWYIEKEEMLDIERFKSKIPSDFKVLEFAYKCTTTSITNNPPGILLTQQTFDHYPLMDMDWHSKQCSDPCCKPPTNCIFNAYEQILVQRGNQFTCYSHPVLLKLGNVDTRRCCVDKCVNIFSTSSDTITIQNGHIYTNFETGSVYFSYRAFPIDEESGLPLIPDNERIEKCIENYIKYNIVKVLVTNKEADLAQLLGIYKQDYLDSLGDAQYETKLPSFNNMVGMVRKNRKRLNTYYQLTHNGQQGNKYI